MGDIADWQLEQAMDHDLYDYQGEFDRQPACKYCGYGPLEWRKTPQGWRLFNTKGLHTCKKYKREEL